jgi:hypothetical protein
MLHWRHPLAHGAGGKDDLPPNPDDERLVDRSGVLFAFVQNGFFAVLAGLVNYFLVRELRTISHLDQVVHSSLVDDVDVSSPCRQARADCSLVRRSA